MTLSLAKFAAGWTRNDRAAAVGHHWGQELPTISSGTLWRLARFETAKACKILPIAPFTRRRQTIRMRHH